MRLENGYCFFWKSKLGNWHMCNFKMVCLDNIEREFSSSEQAFMYLKAELFKDKEIARKLLLEKNQRIVKDLGREIKNFNQEIWEQFREEAMYRACYAKFSTLKNEADELLKYKDYKFVEASPYDKIWGVGLAEENDLILDEKNWKGLNLLGKTLDKVLLKIIEEQK